MPKPRIYIGKLPTDTIMFDIENLVEGFGHIRDLTLHGSYAFVEFDRLRDAEHAIQRLNGINLKGKRIVVEFSKRGNRQSNRNVSRSPPFHRRRSTSRSPRQRNRRRSPSRSRSPLPFRHRSPTPQPAPLRKRNVSLGSLEDGEIRSCTSSTSTNVDANGQQLQKQLRGVDEESHFTRRPLPSAINKVDEEMASVGSASLVSPRHTSPSDDDPSDDELGRLLALDVPFIDGESSKMEASEQPMEHQNVEIDESSCLKAPLIDNSLNAVSPSHLLLNSPPVENNSEVPSVQESMELENITESEPPSINQLEAKFNSPESVPLPNSNAMPFVPNPNESYDLLKDLELTDSDSDVEAAANAPEEEVPVQAPHLSNYGVLNLSISSSSSSSSGSSSGSDDD